MFNIALFEPEIPPNTGNIIRLCANSGSRLHLIHPLGFQLEDRQLRRAGLDYHDLACLQEHQDLEDFLGGWPEGRLFACTTRATRCYSEARFMPGDCLLFGPESRGLPPTLLDRLPDSHKLRIPMCSGNRSLNLANAVAIMLYEAWRQQGFDGAA